VPEADGVAGVDGLGRAWRGGARGGGGAGTGRRPARGVRADERRGLRAEGEWRIVELAGGEVLRARSVIIATGVSYRQLDCPSLAPLNGQGVFYGAAVGEARAMQGLTVHVAGAGNSAGQAALHLARHCAKVEILVRDTSLAKSMSDYLVKEIASTPNVEVRTETEVVDGHGGNRLDTLILRDRRSGETPRRPSHESPLAAGVLYCVCVHRFARSRRRSTHRMDRSRHRP